MTNTRAMKMVGKKGIAAMTGMLIASSLFAGCGQSQPQAKSPGTSAAKPSSTSQPYKIYAILDETGAFSYAGQDEAQVLKLVQQSINQQGGIDGTPIQFAIYDSQSSPKVATQITEQLLTKHIALILGASSVATAQAIDTLTQTSGPVTYALTPGVYPKAHSYVFSTSVSSHAQVQIIMRYAREKGWNRLGFIGTSDASGIDGLQQVHAVLKDPNNHSLSLVSTQQFAPNAVSTSAEVQALKSQNPQAIITWANGPAYDTLIKAMSNAGMTNIPVLSGDGDMASSILNQIKSYMPKELLFSSPAWAVSPNLLQGAVKTQVEQFRATLKSNKLLPNIPRSLVWDPTQIVLHVLSQVGLHATPTQIRDAIENLNGYVGADGAYQFSTTNHRGVGVSDLYIAKWNSQTGDWTALTGPGGSLLTK